MSPYINILENLLQLSAEYEWFDFKENWFNKDEIGQYISAISNGATICGKEFGYIFWGVTDKNHEIVGTDLNFEKDIDNEPYKHYLARNLKPSISFEFSYFEYKSKRIAVLVIPSAKSVPTKYMNEVYIRIGSSKEKASKFPEWEVKLNHTLIDGFPTIVNTEAPDYAQDLSFQKLFLYYAAKGISLRKDTFKKSLKLLSASGKYNIMAMLLADSNSIPIRVSVFAGITKASPLFSIKEFGNTCILYAIDKILEYGDVINIIQADERGRISERKEVPLFNYEAFHEAILNAFIHNKWIGLNSPMLNIFTDRIEILSHGGLAIDQDISGFYNGVSIPVNEILSSIFLQLRLSERSGRGVPKIVSVYGRESIHIDKNYIMVTIPFEKIAVNSFELLSNKVSKIVTRKLNYSQKKIIQLIRNNPNITIDQLRIETGLSLPSIKKNLAILKNQGIIERIGATKNGYWNIVSKK